MFKKWIVIQNYLDNKITVSVPFLAEFDEPWFRYDSRDCFESEPYNEFGHTAICSLEDMFDSEEECKRVCDKYNLEMLKTLQEFCAPLTKGENNNVIN